MMQRYESRSFTAPLGNGDPITHDVYERGEGPPIVLIQELPGIGPETLRLADRLVSAGYRVVLPHLFGPLGKKALLRNSIRVLCMQREFRLFECNASSPIVEWLRALCRDVRNGTGARGVGVIGMCLTGNFALSLMADDSVLASVASQPALPLFTPCALHMSPEEVCGAKARLDREGPMLALRFKGDLMCPAAKLRAIEKTFNDDGVKRVERIDVPGFRHSVLTVHFVDEDGHPTRRALESVLTYFAAKLKH
jgi:dienelactone hydrolase